MVQYHALGLMYHIKKSDRLAVTKLVAKLTRSSMKSPFAVCMLVSKRFTAKIQKWSLNNDGIFIRR